MTVRKNKVGPVAIPFVMRPCGVSGVHSICPAVHMQSSIDHRHVDLIPHFPAILLAPSPLSHFLLSCVCLSPFCDLGLISPRFFLSSNIVMFLSIRCWSLGSLHFLRLQSDFTQFQYLTLSLFEFELAMCKPRPFLATFHCPVVLRKSCMSTAFSQQSSMMSRGVAS